MTSGAWKTLAVFFAVVCLSLTGGCSGEDDASGSGAPSTGAAGSAPASPTGGPSLSVSADKTHAVQPGDVITVTVSAAGFELDDSEGAPAGAGHYRIYLDEASGEDYLARGAAPTTRITLPKDTTDGSHELRVVLYDNDSTPVEPAVEGRVLLIVYRL